MAELPNAPGSQGAPGPLPVSSVVWPDTNESTSLMRWTTYQVGADAETLKRAKRSKEAQQATIAGEGTVVPIVYGQALLGARIAAVVAYQGRLVLLAVWCQGEIDAIETLYVNGAVAGGGINATHYTGTASQTADPTLVAAFAAIGITYADTLAGIAYSVVRVSAKSTTGFPRLMVKVRGLKVRATQLGARSYSENPALALADFIESSEYGMGRLVAWDSVADVADACDALVGSPSEKKRTVGISLDTPQACEDWLNVLRDYAGCWAIPEGASYRLVPDAPGSSVMSFTTANMLAGGPKLAKRGLITSPTVVEVVYTDTSTVPWRDNTVRVSAPGVSDGTTPRRVSRVQKPGITRYSDAYRYAVERLNEALLNDLTITLTALDEALALQVGDIIDVTHPVGLSAKEFRVMKLEPSAPGRWSIVAVEYDPAKYSSTVVTTPTTPDTSLPSPLIVTAPTGLAVAENIEQIQTGRFVSRLVVTWTGPSHDDYVYLEGFVLRYSDGTNETVVELPADARSYTTPALPENLLYTIGLRAASAFAVSSEAIATITNNGKQALPSDVPSISAYSVNGETRVSWVLPIDFDLTSTELRYSDQSTVDWDDALPLVFVPAPQSTYSTTFLPAGPWRIWAKGHDSVATEDFPNGQESANANFVDVTVAPSNTSSSDETALELGTLTNMIPKLTGGWITAFTGDSWNATFPNAMNTYTNPIASYHSSGTSGLVSDWVDYGASEAGTYQSTLDWDDLAGTGQPYLEHKVNSGDTPTKVGGELAVVTARYVRVGIEWTGTDAGQVNSLGVLRKITDATESFVKNTTLNDAVAWML